jgi:phosphatidylethanolamine-binding protein (PEBP) family uncharacterized protein
MVRLPRPEFAARWLLCVPAALAAAGCGSPSSPSSGNAAATPPTATGRSFALSSPAFADGGTLPAKYTCRSQSGLDIETNPPLAWSNPPAGTVGFALLAATVANDAGGQTTKYNWVLYNISASASSIPENNTVITGGATGATQVGTPGLTSDGPLYAYSPPCSAKGSGLRSYTFTLYALSGTPVFAPNHAPGAGGDGASLSASLAGITLGKSAITASYTF